MTRGRIGRLISNALFLSAEDSTLIKGATISKQVRHIVDEIGIPRHYRAHSTRATAASTMLQMSISIEEILSMANASTFMRFYEKDFIEKSQ